MTLTAYHISPAWGETRPCWGKLSEESQLTLRHVREMWASIHLPCVVTEVDQGQRGEPWRSNGDERTVSLVTVHETSRHDPTDRE
jgi:hypothetical protein